MEGVVDERETGEIALNSTAPASSLPSADKLTFDDIHALYSWKEIKNCPGRFVPTKASAYVDRLTCSEVRFDLPMLEFHCEPSLQTVGGRISLNN